MQQVIAKILDQGGLLGALLVFFGLYIWRLQQLLREQQEARVEDAKAYAASLVKINNDWGEKLEGLTAATYGQKDFQERLIALVRDLKSKKG